MDIETLRILLTVSPAAAFSLVIVIIFLRYIRQRDAAAGQVVERLSGALEEAGQRLARIEGLLSVVIAPRIAQPRVNGSDLQPEDTSDAG